MTAIFEIIPTDVANARGAAIDGLKYQKPAETRIAEDNGALLTLKLRFKQPDGDVSKLLTFPLADSDRSFANTDRDFQFASAVASFGMLLRGSAHSGTATFDSVLKIAESATRGSDSNYHSEFIEMVRIAGEITTGSAGKND